MSLDVHADMLIGHICLVILMQGDIMCGNNNTFETFFFGKIREENIKWEYVLCVGKCVTDGHKIRTNIGKDNIHCRGDRSASCSSVET